MESNRIFESHRDDPFHRMCRHNSEGLERHKGAKLLATKHHTNGLNLRLWSYFHHRRCHLLSRLSLCHSLGSSR